LLEAVVNPRERAPSTSSPTAIPFNEAFRPTGNGMTIESMPTTAPVSSVKSSMASCRRVMLPPCLSGICTTSARMV